MSLDSTNDEILRLRLRMTEREFRMTEKGIQNDRKGFRMTGGIKMRRVILDDLYKMLFFWKIFGIISVKELCKLIDYNEKWLEMMEDRNLAVHLYKEEQADELYSRFLDYLRLFQELASQLENFQN